MCVKVVVYLQARTVHSFRESYRLRSASALVLPVPLPEDGGVRGVSEGLSRSSALKKG